MAEICQRDLGEFGIPVECALSIVVPIFMGWVMSVTSVAMEP